MLVDVHVEPLDDLQVPLGQRPHGLDDGPELFRLEQVVLPLPRQVPPVVGVVAYEEDPRHLTGHLMVDHPQFAEHAREPRRFALEGLDPLQQCVQVVRPGIRRADVDGEAGALWRGVRRRRIALRLRAPGGRLLRARVVK